MDGWWATLVGPDVGECVDSVSAGGDGDGDGDVDADVDADEE